MDACPRGAGRFLFDRGFYVQSVIFPAVPYHAGVVRVQINSNHTREAIDGLVDAFGDLKGFVDLPTTDERPCEIRQAA